MSTSRAVNNIVFSFVLLKAIIFIISMKQHTFCVTFCFTTRRDGVIFQCCNPFDRTCYMVHMAEPFTPQPL